MLEIKLSGLKIVIMKGNKQINLKIYKISDLINLIESESDDSKI